MGKNTYSNENSISFNADTSSFLATNPNIDELFDKYKKENEKALKESSAKWKAFLNATAQQNAAALSTMNKAQRDAFFDNLKQNSSEYQEYLKLDQEHRYMEENKTCDAITELRRKAYKQQYNDATLIQQRMMDEEAVKVAQSEAQKLKVKSQAISNEYELRKKTGNLTQKENDDYLKAIAKADADRSAAFDAAMQKEAEVQAKYKSHTDTDFRKNSLTEITQKAAPGSNIFQKMGNSINNVDNRKQVITQWGNDNKQRAQELKQDKLDTTNKLAAEKAKGGAADPKVIASLEAHLRSVNEGIKDNGRDARKHAKEQNKNALQSIASSEQLRKAQAATEEYMKKMLADAAKEIDQDISTFYQYQAKYEARLQDVNATNKEYSEALKKISNQVALSPLISQKSVIQNLQKAIEAGINYNLEYRAFLQTVKEDIADTFDAFSENLTNLVRIQQSDSTAQRLGMEAYLTKMYNTMFSDTSYLSSVFKTVSQNLYEASAMLDAIDATELEYTVQKWLGSLYSVGFSSNAIQKISQGINYLATGDVESLTGDSGLNTLIQMSATRANLSFADLLTNGLTAEKTNTLLKSMVEYLQTIAEQSKDNNVLQKTWTNVLGVQVSDINAVQNLQTSDIANLYSTQLDYSQAYGEYLNQTSMIKNRVHLSTMLSTIKDNALMGTAANIAGSNGLYATWAIASLIKDITGGIDIPFVSAMGTGVDLSTTVMDLIKMGIGGIGLFSSLIGALSSGGGLGASYDAESWGYTSSISRGSAPTIKASGIQTGFSEEAELSNTANTNADDTEGSTLSSAADDSEKKSKITNKNNKTEHTFDEFWEAIYEKNNPIPVKIIEHQGLDDLYNALFTNMYPIAVDGMQVVVGASNVKSSNYSTIVSAYSSSSSGSTSLISKLQSSITNSSLAQKISSSVTNTKAAKSASTASDSILASSVAMAESQQAVSDTLNRIANTLASQSYKLDDIRDNTSNLGSLSVSTS